MRNNQLGAVCGFLACLLGSTPSVNAALYNVDFNDFNGPHWTGVVNTTTDTLTITSWTENSGFPPFWTPTGLPMTWNAVDTTDSPFDVPDSWDGTFGLNWGFLSPVGLGSMSFLDGSIDGGWSGSPWRPGWGIREAGDGIFANFGNTVMPIWPRGNNFVMRSDADSVQVSVAVIPIPPALWLFGSGLLGMIGIARRKKAA